MNDTICHRLPESVRIYEIGGAVRDDLLGEPVTDHDFVVVGATPEMMLSAGFRPVGKDFPVFLHPETHEEYALARTERKAGCGYHGFTFYTAPDVSLADDLWRRDLTINAMARDKHGTLIDPFEGRRDLRARVLRHVSPAFSEDPLRVLRVARFAARLDFDVADETMELMRNIVESGELEALVAERMWQETARALMAQKPSRFLQVLRACGALAVWMPEVDALYGVPQKPEYHPEIDAGIHVEEVLDAAARFHFSLPVRYALLCHDLGKAVTTCEQLPDHHGHESKGAPLVNALSKRLKVPNDCADAARIVTRLHGEVLHVFEMDARALLALLHSCDALRRPYRLTWLIDASFTDCNARAAQPQEDRQGNYLRRALRTLKNVDARKIADELRDDSAAIPLAIRAQQIQALRQMIQAWDESLGS
ncbi:MAG: multifunctional CCA addition/repair protein [Burkholderiales bacterium]|jgi:tRNA nucleotidyltransferase (CCA-adding enzyme)|nr:multifunctional CCA addition/repair protein [Burkholderiales bacterium]